MAITIIIVIARGAKCQINHAINSVLHSQLGRRVASRFHMELHLEYHLAGFALCLVHFFGFQFDKFYGESEQCALAALVKLLYARPEIVVPQMPLEMATRR